MLTSAERYVRFIALGENDRISEVKENGRGLFRFTISASFWTERGKFVKRQRERERESWPKYDSNNTDTRVKVLLREPAYTL